MRIRDLSQEEFAKAYRIYSVKRTAEKLAKKRARQTREKNR